MKESSSTTKHRTVFKGSWKTWNEISLNDCLHTGKNLLPDLIILISNWRKYKYALTADMKQIFRHVIMHKDDRHFQLIFWRFERTEPILIYEFNTVTDGLAASKFLENRVVKQLANNGKSQFP